MSNEPTSPAYVGIEECRKIVFGTGSEAPSKRSWDSWRAKGYYPFLRVGKRIFACPDEVSRALSRRFKVNAIDIK